MDIEERRRLNRVSMARYRAKLTPEQREKMKRRDCEYQRMKMATRPEARARKAIYQATYQRKSRLANLDEARRLNREYMRTWCAANPERWRVTRQKSAAKYRAKRRIMLDTLKLEKGCAVCGFREHPGALHFAHLDPLAKNFNVGHYRVGRSWDALLAEIEKCRVLCANCHAVETVTRRDSERGKARVGGKRPGPGLCKTGCTLHVHAGRRKLSE